MLDSALYYYGFELLRVDETEVVYNKSNIFLKISYWPEDSPNFILMFGIGFIKHEGDSITYDEIGLWRVLPEDKERLMFQFSLKEELEMCIYRFLNEILEQYAKPLWDNPIKLKDMIKTYNDIRISDTEERIREMNRIKARQAYKSKEYEKAIELFDLVDEKYLNVVEKKMYCLCKRELS